MPKGGSDGKYHRLKLAPEESAHLVDNYGTVPKGLRQLVRKDQYDKAVPETAFERKAYLGLEAWCQIHNRSERVIPLADALAVVERALDLESEERQTAFKVIGELQAHRFVLRVEDGFKVLRRRRDASQESAVVEFLQQGGV